MSDLFLDTEKRWYVPFAARTCVESGYDDATLERIFWIEVFPEAIGNLVGQHRRRVIRERVQFEHQANRDIRQTAIRRLPAPV
jgi:hypothetical protein